MLSRRASESRLQEDICIHIFAASAAMVGVCLTVIGIIRLIISTEHASTLADDLLALDAFVFLSACLIAYWALRTPARLYQVERVADGLFLVGLVLMAAICGLVVYVLL